MQPPQQLQQLQREHICAYDGVFIHNSNECRRGMANRVLAAQVVVYWIGLWLDMVQGTP